MREKTSVAKEAALRYGKAKKREKENMLDEFVVLTCTTIVSMQWQSVQSLKRRDWTAAFGKRIESVKAQFPHKTRRVYTRKYDADVIKSVLAIRAFYGHKTGCFWVS